MAVDVDEAGVPQPAELGLDRGEEVGRVVVHGIDFNGNGTYDFSAIDRSDLKRSLPGEITAPGLCGPLVPASKPPGSKTKTGRVPGGRQIYTASLELSGATKLDGAGHGWLCPLGGATGDQRKRA